MISTLFWPRGPKVHFSLVLPRFATTLQEPLGGPLAMEVQFPDLLTINLEGKTQYLLIDFDDFDRSKNSRNFHDFLIFVQPDATSSEPK